MLAEVVGEATEVTEAELDGEIAPGLVVDAVTLLDPLHSSVLRPGGLLLLLLLLLLVAATAAAAAAAAEVNVYGYP